MFVLVALLLVAVPVAAVAFARSGRGLRELGRGRFAVDFETDTNGDSDPATAREEEIAQLTAAREYRRDRRRENGATDRQ